MANALEAALSAAQHATCVVTPDQLLTDAKLDHINPFSLLQWANESKIVHKVAGHYAGLAHTSSTRTPLYALLAFLRALGSDAGQGCVLLDAEGVRYVLLDAAAPFAELAQRAHSIILASGTLSPIDVLTTQLFPHNNTYIITHHVFGHVVPQSHLCTTIMTECTNSPLNFNFANRPTMLGMLATIIQRLAKVVPHGMVVFFPSTRYMEAAVAAGVGRVPSKQLFVETPGRGDSSVLQAYTTAAIGSQGALLFSVAGGKLSEGINFSDEAGRCVVVVGLPYPDASSAEMQQRLEFARQFQGGEAAKRAVYDGACFKVVNQCIGRVLRHAQDYAAVVLLDERYARHVDKLPRWVVGGVGVAGKEEVVVGEVERFFARHRQ